jgi:uncharacterized membrane protein
VLIMIEAHTLDSWTQMAERTRTDYKWAIVVGGFGAPIFLFLAGVALALAAGARLQRGMSEADVLARARRRGWEIFGLAFLFRMQSAVLGGGGLRSLLKVDVLNIMGLALLATAVVWGLVRHPTWKAVLLVTASAAASLLTPIVREARLFESWPAPIAAYVVPVAAYSGFTLLPWAGFVLAGAGIGLWLEQARTPADERRVIVRLAVLGPVLAISGYAMSFLPPIYRETSFWTSSPTFFLLRMGVLITAIPIAYAWRASARRRSRLEEFGIASLFVYWIHVEMVYGFLTWPIHRRLSFGQAILAFAVFTLILYGLVRLKERILGTQRQRSGRPSPSS